MSLKIHTFGNSDSISKKTSSNEASVTLDAAFEYEKNIREAGVHQNPIIVIPGILGSNLVENQSKNPVWGDFGKPLAGSRGDEYLRLISLPMEHGKTLDQLQGRSTSDGSLRYIRGNIAGMPIKINAYASMMAAMGVGGEGAGQSIKKLDDNIDDRRHEANAFEFDYDWRRSIDENAIRLGDYIEQVTRFVRLQRGTHDPVKFDIVAHSMGGLIARYYLQYGRRLLPTGNELPILDWSGAAQVERVILVGTPNGGSLFALERLIIGLNKKTITPAYDPIVLGTLPSIYQLLPRVRHKAFVQNDGNLNSFDYFNIGLWVDFNWGLANRNKDQLLARILPGTDSSSIRREIALDHLEKCLNTAKNLHQALDRAHKRPDHLKMFLFVGDETSTPLVATAKKGDTKLTILKKGAGDGTVPRYSVLLDERVGEGKWIPKIASPLKWNNVVLLTSNHLRLTRDPLCIKNILYILLERP